MWMAVRESWTAQSDDETNLASWVLAYLVEAAILVFVLISFLSD